MSDRKKHHGVASWPAGAESVPIRYLPVLFLLLGAGLVVMAAIRRQWLEPPRARLEVGWSAEHGDHVYHLRGRYTVASLSGDFATTLSNAGETDRATSSVMVPAGLYRVTLQPGYTLERSASKLAALEAAGPFPAGGVELVPASLVTSPLLILAKDGQLAQLGLSLVDMPGTAAEREETCMNGS